MVALRVTALFRKRKLEERLNDELRVHLELSAEENVRRGMTPDDARYMGRLRPGISVQQAQADVSTLLRGFLDEEVRRQVSAQRWQEIKDCFIVLTSGSKGI